MTAVCVQYGRITECKYRTHLHAEKRDTDFHPTFSLGQNVFIKDRCGLSGAAGHTHVARKTATPEKVATYQGNLTSRKEYLSSGTGAQIDPRFFEEMFEKKEKDTIIKAMRMKAMKRNHTLSVIIFEL